MDHKAVIYQDGMLGSLLLGQSKVNPMKLREFLNLKAKDVWECNYRKRQSENASLLEQRGVYHDHAKREKSMKTASIIFRIVFVIYAIIGIFQLLFDIFDLSVFLNFLLRRLQLLLWFSASQFFTASI